MAVASGPYPERKTKKVVSCPWAEPRSRRKTTGTIRRPVVEAPVPFPVRIVPLSCAGPGRSGGRGARSESVVWLSVSGRDSCPVARPKGRRTFRPSGPMSFFRSVVRSDRVVPILWRMCLPVGRPVRRDVFRAARSGNGTCAVSDDGERIVPVHSADGSISRQSSRFPLWRPSAGRPLGSRRVRACRGCSNGHRRRSSPRSRRCRRAGRSI